MNVKYSPLLDGAANLEQKGDVMAVAGLLKLFLVRRNIIKCSIISYVVL